MSFLGGLFGPKDFSGRVSKLFLHYKNETRMVKTGIITSADQLYGVICGLCYILHFQPEQLDYEQIEIVANMYTMVACRCESAAMFGFSDAIQRTPQELMKRFKDIISTDKIATQATSFLFECVQNKTSDANFYVKAAQNARQD